ncbi:MAG: hypothetical protein E4G89_04830 [Methanothrix sp.]|nr:MAG: hypothetical protein E4G89_04830 [Methanothrix sp.]
MRHILLVVLLASVIAISALPAFAAAEEDTFAEYIAHFRQMGTSDSLLAQLETSIRQPTRDSTWEAEHNEIVRKIYLEYRINKLKEIMQNGTLEERAAAYEKIQELLQQEKNR